MLPEGLKMKILITTDWYKPTINGVVTSVINLEKELRKMGHDVKILTLSRNHRSYTRGNVTYIGSFSASVFYPNARMKLPMRRKASKLLHELMDWHPDIIHTQCEFSTFICAKKISHKLNIPIVHTYHTVYEDYTHYFAPNEKIGRRAVVDFSKKVAEFCTEIIAPTQKVCDMLNRYGVNCPVSVIPTGINLDKFAYDEKAVDEIKAELNIQPDDFTAVYIGRLAKEKNVNELIEMHSQISNPHIKLLIVGGGPEYNNLKQLVEENGLSEKIIFTNMVKPNKIAKYYKCGDVFVSASTSETQGLTYFEALASGTPAVCKKDDCLANVIQNGENGFQYTSDDEYIKIINQLSADKNYTNTLAQNALNSSQEFGSEIFAKNVLKLYEKTLENHKNGKIQLLHK
jgi:1,2-diacylglycerol 3-alpha-glucosyltransferase